MKRVKQHIAMSAIIGLSLTFTHSAHAKPYFVQNQASKSNPVILVHGWEPHHHAKVDCVKKFQPIIQELKNQGFSKITTVTYYKDSKNCDVNLTNLDSRITKESSWKDIGRALSVYVHNQYSRYGQPVDMLGHSMGGLVIRSAIQGGSERLVGFSPMLVEDVVTIATPHQGSGLSIWCIHKQCLSLSPQNPDFKWLASNPKPDGIKPIDWSVQGSTWDALVNTHSSMAMNVDKNHRKLFDFLAHNQQLVASNSVKYAVASLATDQQ